MDGRAVDLPRLVVDPAVEFSLRESRKNAELIGQQQTHPRAFLQSKLRLHPQPHRSDFRALAVVEWVALFEVVPLEHHAHAQRLFLTRFKRKLGESKRPVVVLVQGHFDRIAFNFVWKHRHVPHNHRDVAPPILELDAQIDSLDAVAVDPVDPDLVVLYEAA